MLSGANFLNWALVVSALVGVLGFSAMTWLFPAMARVCSRLTGRSIAAQAALAGNAVRHLSILIPAHNEERTLVETVPSMLASIRFLKTIHPGIQVDIRVGADGCSDRTVEIARSLGVEVTDSPVSRGKWRTVHELVKASSQADWIVLSDAGIVWPETFLAECVPYCQQVTVIGVAPTYRNPFAGPVEKMIWKLESVLKTMENIGGGPVTVHGSTVLYRKTELLEAFDTLSAAGTTWINDDVALALYLRLTHSDRRIVYVPSIVASDCPAAHLEASGTPIREFNRRKRMVLGNLQWITLILLPRCRQNPLAALIALRRIFRVIWAYWIVAFVVAAALTAALLFGFGYFLILGLAGVGAGVFFVGTRPVQMLIDSGFVSLLAPYYLVSGQALSRWK